MAIPTYASKLKYCGTSVTHEYDTTGGTSTSVTITNWSVREELPDESSDNSQAAPRFGSGQSIREANIEWQQLALAAKNRKYNRWLDRQALSARRYKQEKHARRQANRRPTLVRRMRNARCKRGAGRRR